MLGSDSGRPPSPRRCLSRDLHANYIATLAGIAASLEKIAVEIRHLQRTEVREAEEPFAAGQKGSSAMPHKRNPVMCEQISGLARVSAPTRSRLSKTWRCGMSGISRILRSSASICLIRPSWWTTCLRRPLAYFWPAGECRPYAAEYRSHSRTYFLANCSGSRGGGMLREDAYKLVQVS